MSFPDNVPTFAETSGKVRVISGGSARQKFERPLLDLIFFIFMQFSEKFGQITIIIPFEVGTPLWEMLDPSLVIDLLCQWYTH